jgi:hypothetical protein
MYDVLQMGFVPDSDQGSQENPQGSDVDDDEDSLARAFSSLHI